MTTFNASKCAQYISSHKNPLIVAGEACDHIKLDKKLLTEYAAKIALKLDCQVAATGNSVLKLKKHDGIKAKKMWLAELIIALKGKWADPILSERPDLLIFIGYRPEVIDGMVAGLKRIHSVHLGPGKSLATNKGVEAVKFSEWGSNLDDLINAI
jgi:CO dehydrogenase/acetyl-CoA synthase epsilon subunit